MLKDSDDDIVFKICVDYGLDPDDADDREMARSSGVFAQWRLAEDMRVLGHELRAQAQRSWVGRMMARVSCAWVAAKRWLDDNGGAR